MPPEPTPRRGPESLRARLGRCEAELKAHRLAMHTLNGYFTHSAEPMLILAADHRVVRANPALRRLAGRPEKELIGLAFRDLLHPDDQAALAGGPGPLPAEARLAARSGRGAWVAWTALPYPEEGLTLAVGRDNSADHAAREALVASEERFRGLANLAPVGIFLTDAQGQCVYVNQRWTEITGRTRKQALGRGWEQAVHPLDRALVILNWRKLALAAALVDTEFRCQTLTGETKWVHVLARPLVGGDGALEGFLGTVSDITRRRGLDEALRDSEEKFSKAFRASPTWVGVNTIMDERFLDVNDTMLAMTGYQREEVVGRTALELGLWPDPRRRRRLIEKLKTLGRLADEEVSLAMRDGSQRHFLWFAELINIAGEACSVNVLSDVTRLKLAERELEASEQRFRLLFQRLPVGSALVGLNQHFINVNPEFSRFLGYEREELLRLTMDAVTFPEDLPVCRQGVADLLAGRIEEFRLEKRYLRKDGSPIWGRLWLRLVRDHQGQPLYLLPVVEDIDRLMRAEAKRRELEASLERARRLESLGVMAAGVAHDFNNLLQGVVSHLELAELDLTPLDKARPAVAQALHEALRASRISHQMLAYSGHLPFLPVRMDLSELAADLGRRLAQDWPQGLELELDLAKDLPAFNGDPLLIEQALGALLTNAMEAMAGQGGKVSLRTGLAHLGRAELAEVMPARDLKPGDYLYVEVEDRGPGLGLDQGDRIFDPFYTTKFAGRGMGLAVVLGAARTHRGGVQSGGGAGGGARFRLWLPARAGRGA